MEFTTRRYWAIAGPLAHLGRVEIGRRVDEIARLLKSNVEAVAVQPGAVSNLTAGCDTRMILAALKDHASRLRFTTMRLPDRMGEQDCFVAGRIAERHGLAHLELHCDQAIQADIDDWLVNTGYCVGGRTLQLATTAKRIANLATFNLTGLGGDIGRAVDWRKEDFRRDAISIVDLLHRLGLDMPLLPLVEEAGRDWLDALPCRSVPEVLDMALMEMTLASCSSLSFYGHCHGGISISPFNDRRMIELMLSLPARYRFRQRLAPDLIERLWPEMNLFLFNPLTSRPRELHMQRLGILARRARRLGRRIAAFAGATRA
jgi:hypothetical protein